MRSWPGRPNGRTRPKGQNDGAVKRTAQFVRHNLTTCKIDLTGPDTAKVRTYWMVITDIGPDHSGVYVDDFRNEDGQWLIAHRQVRSDWFSPDSHFGSGGGSSKELALRAALTSVRGEQKRVRTALLPGQQGE